MVVFKNRLINEGYLKDGVWLKIWYSKHALKRLDERSGGTLNIKPLDVKVSRNNLVRGVLIDGKLNNFVVRIPYTRNTDMYLVLTSSIYHKNGYLVKTLWFRDKHNHNNNSQSKNVLSGNLSVSVGNY